MEEKNHTIKSLVKWCQDFEEMIDSFSKRISSIENFVEETRRRLDRIEEALFPAAVGIQRVEAFNGEQVPPVRENLKMNDEDKIQSIVNACAILPPNRKNKEGRHSIEDIEALVGFKVTHQQIAAAYRIAQ